MFNTMYLIFYSVPFYSKYTSINEILLGVSGFAFPALKLEYFFYIALQPPQVIFLNLNLYFSMLQNII